MSAACSTWSLSLNPHYAGSISSKDIINRESHLSAISIKVRFDKDKNNIFSKAHLFVCHCVTDLLSICSVLPALLDFKIPFVP